MDTLVNASASSWTDEIYPTPLPTAQMLVPSPLTYFPIYHTSRTELIPGVSDLHLSLAVPVVCYWAYSLFWHVLDKSDLAVLDKYRIHEPEEVTRRNRVTVPEVIKAVILQHVIQTLLGLAALAEEEPTDNAAAMLKYARVVTAATVWLVGPRFGHKLLAQYGSQAVQFIYWWGVPIVQFLWASFVLDTWQYFWHRLMHINKWLYRNIHSRHHRLYCPYSFGALYNHPIEGFILDTLGTVVAHALAGLTIRQDVILFGVSTLKTVDDHCGFALPWDPFQMLFGNNAEYHDTHHQNFGLKKNFSQPYFTHWDVLLGTRMKRSEIPKKAHTDLRDPKTQAENLTTAGLSPNAKKDL